MQDTETSWHKVAVASEVAPQSGRTVIAGDRELALFNDDGAFYALGNLCPHRGAPLSDGFLADGKVLCSWHCFDFDLHTGKCGSVPELRVPVYEVQVRGDEIFVRG